MLIEHSLSSFHNCHIKSSTKGKPQEPFTLHCMHINEAGSCRVVFEAIGRRVVGGVKHSVGCLEKSEVVQLQKGFHRFSAEGLALLSVRQENRAREMKPMAGC